MAKPIALQLYTVREAMNADFEGTVRRVAEMGYVGVETAGFPGTTPTDAARLFSELGLEVTSAHSPLPEGDKKNEVLETMDALSCKRLVCPYMPPEDFASVDGIKRVAERLNAANEVAKASGLTFGYHNHWFEYGDIEGKRADLLLLEHLDPSIWFEVDTYWVKTAGHDPVAVINALGERAPLLHIKDGPAVQSEDMVAAGEGVMDIPAIVEAGREHAEWLIVELDRCATEMIVAVEKSYKYLVGEGLARGNR